MGFLSNKIWVRIFLGHPWLAGTSVTLVAIVMEVWVRSWRSEIRLSDSKRFKHIFEINIKPIPWMLKLGVDAAIKNLSTGFEISYRLRLTIATNDVALSCQNVWSYGHSGENTAYKMNCLPMKARYVSKVLNQDINYCFESWRIYHYCSSYLRWLPANHGDLLVDTIAPFWWRTEGFFRSRNSQNSLEKMHLVSCVVKHKPAVLCFNAIYSQRLRISRDENVFSNRICLGQLCPTEIAEPNIMAIF